MKKSNLLVLFIMLCFMNITIVSAATCTSIVSISSASCKYTYNYFNTDLSFELNYKNNSFLNIEKTSFTANGSKYINTYTLSDISVTDFFTSDFKCPDTLYLVIGDGTLTDGVLKNNVSVMRSEAISALTGTTYKASISTNDITCSNTSSGGTANINKTIDESYYYYCGDSDIKYSINKYTDGTYGVSSTDNKHFTTSQNLDIGGVGCCGTDQNVYLYYDTTNAGYYFSLTQQSGARYQNELTCHNGSTIDDLTDKINEYITDMEDMTSKLTSFVNGDLSLTFDDINSMKVQADWYKARVDEAVAANKIKSTSNLITSFTNGYNSFITSYNLGLNKINNTGTDVTTCEDLLGPNVLNLLKTIFKMIQIIGPIIALGLGMYDILMALANGEDDAKKKAFKKLGRRIAAAVLLLLLPYIVDFILSLIPGISGSNCLI